MKSKLPKCIAIFVFIFSMSTSFAQTAIPNGENRLVEFTNASSKFTVPEGKTWYISNIFSSYENANQETNYIVLKKINNTSFGNNGPILSNTARAFFSYPLILPQKTYFEIQISDENAKAIMIYTEVSN